MKNLFFGVLSLLCFSGCMSTKKYAVFVDEKTSAERFDQAPQEWLVVNLPATETKGNTYRQLRHSFVPALVYWEWNSTIECELDPATVGNYVKSGIAKAADSLGLQSKLKGKQLVVNLKQVPGSFLYENKGSVLFLLIAYSTSGMEAISPAAANLEVEYQLKENEQVIRNGHGVIQNRSQPLQNIWKSSKKFTWAYLDQYKRETDRMGAELVQTIIKQIEN